MDWAEQPGATWIAIVADGSMQGLGCGCTVGRVLIQVGRGGVTHVVDADADKQPLAREGMIAIHREAAVGDARDVEGCLLYTSDAADDSVLV